MSSLLEMLTSQLGGNAVRALGSKLGVEGESAKTALGAALLHANVAQFGGDYFSAFAERNPLEHTWSLSVEEHFYLATFAAVGAFSTQAG